MPSFLRHARPGAALAVTLGCLAWAGTAMGVGEPTGLSMTPGSPTQAGSLSFSWGPPSDAPAGYTFTGEYVGGLAPDGLAVSDPLTSPHTPSAPEGRLDFTVAARFTDGVTTISGNPARVTEIVVDRTAPTVSLGLSPASPNGLNGWYTSLTINRMCSDGPLGSGVVTACGPLAWTQDKQSSAYTYQVSDAVELSSPLVETPAFKFDRTKPLASAGLPVEPGVGALVADEPAFTWTAGADATSGPIRYELQYRTEAMDEFEVMAVVADRGGLGDYTARRSPALAPALPEREPVRWRVVTFDEAGNFRESDTRQVTIDSTVPAAPTITSGPAAPTQISSPTFTWTGNQETYLWDLTRVGAEAPTRRGGGVANQVTLSNLPDGSYTFRVTQVTAAGRPSAEATRTFTVDTTAPAAPSILVRPPFPAISAPVFSWAVEPGAYSRWTVLGGTGAAVVGTTDTPTTTAALPVLGDGAYSFQVRQIDAAGNVSPAAAEPFTMLAPLVPAPAPSTAAAIAKTLPRQNAVRLKPKAGKIIPTRSPVLQWRKGPRGTKLYNLQLFRVTVRKGAQPRITKVLSAFPRGRQYRAPRKNVKPGTCYVWRVWPYTGRAFTPKPVGVSNFCVASAKVVKKKEAQARAKRIASLREAARRARS